VDRIGWLSLCCVGFWIVIRPWSTAAAGFTTNLPFRWHPASWLAESYIIGRRNWRSLLALVSLGAVILAIALLPYPGCFISWLLALAYLLPLWHIFLDTLKRDHTVRSRRIILFQPRSPLNSKVEKKTDSSGRIFEVAPEVYWFMDRNDMDHLAGATKDDKKVLTACRIAAGFYKAPVTNEFLQIFDSLSLYKFLVDHSNPKTMMAVEDLARFFEGAKAGKVVAPAVRPATTQGAPRAVTPPPTRTIASETQDLEEEPVSDQSVHGEPPAEDLRSPEPEELLKPEDRTVNPRRTVTEVGIEEAGTREDSENEELDFQDPGTEGEEAAQVTTPNPGQTSKAQEEELRSVRDRAIVLPSGTATGPREKVRRGTDKRIGGQKRKLSFKSETGKGTAN
jgi:hypothetical protein